MFHDSIKVPCYARNTQQNTSSGFYAEIHLCVDIDLCVR